jgi:hypothetical protein
VGILVTGGLRVKDVMALALLETLYEIRQREDISAFEHGYPIITNLL